MKAIDEPRLESDLSYRFGYLTEFIGFDDGDITAIHGVAEHLAPLVPGLVDAATSSFSSLTRQSVTSFPGSMVLTARCPTTSSR